MSQKVEVTCDRCGKMISLYQDIKNSSAKIQLWGVGEYRASGGQRIDLCEDCYCEFVTLMTAFITKLAFSLCELCEREHNASCTHEDCFNIHKQWLESEAD